MNSNERVFLPKSKATLHIGKENFVFCTDSNLKDVKLTEKQRIMLYLLMDRVNSPVSYSELYEALFGSSNNVDIQVLHRIKYDFPLCIRSAIDNLSGRGYRLMGTLETDIVDTSNYTNHNKAPSLASHNAVSSLPYRYSVFIFDDDLKELQTIQNEILNSMRNETRYLVDITLCQDTAPLKYRGTDSIDILILDVVNSRSKKREIGPQHDLGYFDRYGLYTLASQLEQTPELFQGTKCIIYTKLPYYSITPQCQEILSIVHDSWMNRGIRGKSPELEYMSKSAGTRHLADIIKQYLDEKYSLETNEGVLVHI